MKDFYNKLINRLDAVSVVRVLGVWLMILFFFPVEAQELGGKNKVLLIGQIINQINGAPIKNHAVFVESDTIYNPSFSYHSDLYTDDEGYFYDTIDTYVNKGGLIITTYDYQNSHHDTTVFFRFNWSEENFLFPNFSLPSEPPQIEYQANFYYVRNPNGSNISEFQFFDLTNSNNVISREWNFGDGNISTEVNPVHQFTTSGVYRVMLTVVIQLSQNEIPIVTSIVKFVNVTVKSYYYLGGHVIAGYFPIDYGEAFLYKIENNEMILIDTAIFNDSLGYYLFHQLIEGEYIVKADLCPNSVHFNHYMTTYYSDKPFWDEADTVFLHEDGCDFNIDLIPLNQIISGMGSLSGTIFYGFDPDKGKYLPATNVEILLLDENFEPAICSHSNENGEFNFEDLELSEYYIHAEVTGKYTFPVKVTLSEDNPQIEEIMLTIGNYTVNGNVNAICETNISELIGHPYPNPAANEVFINFDIPSETTIEVMVYTLSGQLFNEPFTLNSAEHDHLRLDTGKMNPGIYFIKMINGDTSIIRKFVKN
jgi:hypothetical protein